MAARATKTTARRPVGGFGTSARDLDWGKRGNGSDSAREASAGPTSAETAAVPSSFGGRASKRPPKGPSAAMGGGSRFAPAKEATGGAEYVPPALGTSKSYNGNRRTSLLGTMGSSKRFTEVKVAAATNADYSDARPGAFSSSSKKTGASNTGFGGMSSRSTFADASIKRAEANAASHLSYDVGSTGAFAKASQSTNKSSSAFASKSSQRQAVYVNEGPTAQSYNTAGVGSLASSANKSFNKSLQKGTGGFGTSAKRESGIMSARGADVPGPGEYAPDVSDPQPHSARPSSAFASTTRKAESVRATVDADYNAHSTDGMAAVATKTFNAKSNGSMGTSKRFTPAKECAQGDYSDARPGAFVSSGISGKQNAGFGGMSSRSTFADAAAKRAEENASSHLSYDTTSTGAFAKAADVTSKSAAFASKSSQRQAVYVNEGPTAQSYNTAGVGSLASSANKSFNKSLQKGTGGFGTSAKRESGIMSARGADVPGPGEYAPDVSDPQPQSARPSSAFASTTRKAESVRATVDADYNAHSTDGMAAVATKTFNKKGAFGSQAVRQIHEAKGSDLPGPGDYQQADPLRPTVDSGLRASKGKSTGAFASTTLRDPSQWANNSSFLP